MKDELERVQKEREERERYEKDQAEVEKAPEEVLVTPTVKTRRPSRFAVSSVVHETEAETVSTSDLLLMSPTNASTVDKAMAELNSTAASEPAEAQRQIKGILKKQVDNFCTVHGFARSADFSPVATPYQTVSGVGERWRNTVQSMQQMFAGAKKNSAGIEGRSSLGWDFGEGLFSPMGTKGSRRMDMLLEEQRKWEEQEMENPVNFNELHFDPNSLYLQ